MTGCDSLIVTFLDETPGNILARQWWFPGGTPATSTAQSPTVIYRQPGIHPVYLGVRNVYGVDTLSLPAAIVQTDPMAAFSYVSNGTTVTFTNQSIGGANSYLWDFGDGDTSTQINPVHVYAAKGGYTVKLEVRNACGNAIRSQSIAVGTTGIESDGWVEHLSIYPNPTTGDFTVDLQAEPSEDLQITLLNALGQMVLQHNAALQTGAWKNTLDAGAVPAGVYLLQIQSGKRLAFRKLVVDKP